MKKTTHDSNGEVMVKPHNESGGVREKLQNYREKVFRDTSDWLVQQSAEFVSLKLFTNQQAAPRLTRLP